MQHSWLCSLPGDSAHLQYGTQRTSSRVLLLGSLVLEGGDPLVGVPVKQQAVTPMALLLLLWFPAASLEFLEAISPPSPHR